MIMKRVFDSLSKKQKRVAKPNMVFKISYTDNGNICRTERISLNRHLKDEGYDAEYLYGFMENVMGMAIYLKIGECCPCFRVIRDDETSIGIVSRIK